MQITGLSLFMEGGDLYNPHESPLSEKMKPKLAALTCLLLAFPNVNRSEKLYLQILAQRRIYISYNKSASHVGLFDPQSNLTMIFDGNGGGFTFQYERSQAIYLPPEKHLFWDSKKENFSVFFAKTQSPNDLFLEAKKQGLEFEPLTTSRALDAQMARDLATMSPDFGNQQALATVVQTSKLTAEVLRGPLKGLEKNVGDIFVECRGDVRWLVVLFQGVADLCSDFKGGIEGFTKKKIRLDFGKIASEPSGFYVLGYFIKTLADRYKLGKILARRLNSQDSFFSLVNRLGGEPTYYSFDGSVFIISLMVQVNFGKHSRETLRSSLGSFYASPRAVTEDFSGKWESNIRGFLGTIDECELGQALEPLVTLLTDILEGQWVYKGVNMTKALELVVSTKPPGNDSSINRILDLLGEDE